MKSLKQFLVSGHMRFYAAWVVCTVLTIGFLALVIAMMH
jgi:hypothetical protein